jgi:ABC-type antimicrobial peptide transport system permease subunit
MAELRGPPTVLAALLLVLIAFAVCHSLLVAARSRRHELGVLQALGATPRDVRMVLMVQALTVALIACAAGVFAGLVVSRVSWQLLMDSFGVLAEPTAAPVVIASVLAAVIALAVVASLWPSQRALRVSPAKALSTE